MTDKPKKWWDFTDSNGEYYPWFQDQWDWVEETKVSGILITMWPEDGYPILKLSQYVQILEGIRTQPDLMARIADWATKHDELCVWQPKSETERNPFALVHVVTYFAQWYARTQMGIIHPIPYIGHMFFILYDQARGVAKPSDADADALCGCLWDGSYVNDVPNSVDVPNEDKRILSCTNSKGEEFPWRKEYFAWIREDEANNPDRSKWVPQPIPKLTLSLYLEAMNAVRAEPDLISRIREWARKHPEEPNQNWEREERAEDFDPYNSLHTVSIFVEWYMRKHYGITHRVECSATVYIILIAQMRGQLPSSDIEAFRKHVTHSRYIDDLK
jgi:hypothetical protein